MDQLENYKPKYQNRVYYANACNLCFSSEKLLKCGSCLAVSYCSKQHQMDDWLFHKPTCVALKIIKSKISLPRYPDSLQFYLYRRTLMKYMVIHRNLKDSSDLTQYERQICSLPWVCSVCYKKPSSNFECLSCRSVIYCSSEHMEKDELNHIKFCWRLRYSRLVASIGYENGFKFDVIPYAYKKIRSGHKRWPFSKFELCTLIQNEQEMRTNPEDIISMSIFMDPYIPAATILNALENAGFIKKRHLIRKLIRDKKGKKTDRRYGKTKSTLTIHFAIADEYELAFQWPEVAQLLSDWLINVNKVEIVLTGPALETCIVPPYENRGKLAGVFVHKTAYQMVDCLTIPDVIVMFECHRSLSTNIDQFWNDDHVDALFRYYEVPVILASGDKISFQKMCNDATSFFNVEMVIGITWNSFTEMNDHREWREHMCTYHRNTYFAVFAKCEY